MKVTHYGTVRLGDIELEAAVLEDGRRGFVQRQMMQAIGLTDGNRGVRLERFSQKIGLNELINKDKSECKLSVSMPHGGNANWVPWEILPAIIKGVSKASREGKFLPQHHQDHIVDRCSILAEALIGVGIVALIDEATGYQYHREPAALQDLITRLIQQTATNWQRRFHPDYYAALCRLFGWQYDKHRALPNIIGDITNKWVYEAVFPAEIMQEIRTRQKSEKLHQWVTGDGLPLLEKQRDAVTMIARSSTDYADFNARCSVAFYRKGQIGMVFPATIALA